MREPAGRWVTAAYVVRLSDGPSRSVYAESQEEPEERMRRHLARIGDERTVVPGGRRERGEN